MAILGAGLGVIGIILAWRGWRRTRTPEARFWALGLVALAGWALSESGAIAAADPQARIAWLRLQVLGVAGIAPLFLLGALQYSGAVFALRPVYRIGIFLIPALTVLLALTNSAHRLVWSLLEVRPDGTLALAYGPWFWIHTLFAVLAAWVALGLLLPTLLYAYRMALREVIGLGLAIALIFTSLFIVLHDPSYAHRSALWRSMTAPLLGLATVLLGLVFRALPVVHPIPIARALIVEAMAEGIMVLDPRGRVVDVNAPMARLLGRPPAALLGRGVEEALAAWPELQGALRAWLHEGRERIGEVRHPAEERWFLFSLQPILRRGARLGWTVRASEITEYKQNLLRHARYQDALLRLATDPEIHGGDPEAAMARIAWVAAETMQVSRVNIWRLDESAGRLECLVHVEWPAGALGKGIVLRLDDYPAYFEALRTGRVVDAADARHDPRTRELRGSYLEPFGICSILDAPIRQGGRVVGIICHEQVGETRSWTPDEIAFATGVADLIASVWANAERRAAEARAQRYAQQLQLLQQISQELFQAADLPRLYALALQGILEVLAADRAAILLRDPDGVVRFKAWRNLSEAYRQAVEGHWPWDPADPNPQILWIPDVEQAPELGGVREVMLREGIRALAFVPIRGAGQAVGKLMLYYDQPRAPDAETLRLAQTLADAMAAALRQRRETWLWEAIAVALREILESPPQFSARVRVILRAARRLLEADRAGLWFYEPARGQVACAGAEGLSDEYIQWLLENYRQVPGARAIEIPTVLHVSDTWTDPRLEGVRDRIRQEGFRAYAVFPLWASSMVHGQLPFRGVLTVYWDVVRILTPEELLIGQAFANAAAQALANVYLFEETWRRARYEAALSRVIQAIFQADGLEEILRTGLDQALSVTGLGGGAIYLWEEGRSVLRLRVAAGELGGRALEGAEDRPGEGLIGRVFIAERAIVLNDLPLELRDSIQQGGIRAWVGIPLRVGARPVGVLSLQDPNPRLFTEEELALLRTLADHLALAVERAALVERMAEQVQEVSLLYQASANLLATREVGAIVSLLGRFLCDITGGGYARVYRYRPESDALERLSEFIAPHAAPSEDPTWIERIRPVTLPLQRAVLAERRPMALWIPGLEAFERSPASTPLTPEDREALKRLGVRRLLILPLAVGTRVLGLAEVWDARGDHEFSLNQIALSQAIANHAAVALENVRLLELLAAERGRLRTLMDAAVDGIVGIGIGGEVVELNPAAVHLLDLGSSPEAWIGRSILDILRALRGRRPALARTLVRHLRALRRDPSSAQTIELDTETRSLRVHVVPIRSEGTALGWLVILQDLTPLRTLERLREELFHMVVHDLRSPVASVQTALDFLLSEGLGPLAPDQREVLTIARENIGRMLRLVNTILELRRWQSGEVILHPKPVVLAEMVREVLRELSMLIRGKALEVRVDLPAALPPVWGDELAVFRILQNLLDNAIKFTPAGKVIAIRAALEQRDGTPWVKVVVADSGPGVPPELREQIFKPFVTGMVKGRGVGLGLAFCKLAVEAHGGRIWVEDAPEGGVAFVFTLPAAPPE